MWVIGQVISLRKERVWIQKQLLLVCHLKELLLQKGVVPGLCAVISSELQGAVDAAHGEADDIEHIQGTQQAKVGPPVSLPLEAHQLLHWCLVQDLASLQQE